MQNFTKIIKRSEVFSGKWLRFKIVDYENNGILIKSYEYIERITRKGAFDGVDILGFVKYPKSKLRTKILLIANYRPPIGKYVIQFPAGLVENEGNCLEEAIRETKEETGFTARHTTTIDIQDIPQISPILYGDSWKSTECGKLVVLEINGDDDVNQKVTQTLEVTESIKVVLFDVDITSLQQLLKFAETNSYEIDSKVYALFLGMSINHFLKFQSNFTLFTQLQ